MAGDRQPRPRKAATKVEVRAQGEEVAFDYIKSNFFRVIHVDGVIGGITPSGWIHMAIWNQRTPLPDRVTHQIEGQGIGPEVSRVQRESLLRELEAGLTFSPEMAAVMIGWLTKQLEELKEIKELVKI
jgi:hypothetical protein